MARPFFPHEVDDPDLDWLVSNFLYERPDFVAIECSGLPLVLLPFHEAEENDECKVKEDSDPVNSKSKT